MLSTMSPGMARALGGRACKTPGHGHVQGDGPSHFHRLNSKLYYSLYTFPHLIPKSFLVLIQ